MECPEIDAHKNLMASSPIDKTGVTTHRVKNVAGSQYIIVLL